MNQLQLRFRCSVAVILAWLAGSAAHAATFSVSPSAISNEFNGVVTLQINQLANGETVAIRKYADLNGNGLIDAGDMLMEDFRLTDGFVTTIGGATNLNVPYDSTGSNAAITTTLNFFANDSIRHFIGTYLFQLSSPGGSFAPLTNSFAVTNSPHSQRITGRVRNGAGGVAGATVVLLTPPPDQNLVAGTTTDGSGNYSLDVASGTYFMLGLRSGFVGNFSGSPIVVLNPNATIITNIDLIAATRVVAGKLVNAANTNLGLPGVILFSQSSGDSYTLSSTDTNGTFNLPVIADTWQLQPQSEDLEAHGFVGLQSWPQFDTTGGSVSNALIAAPPGTAMFHGSIRRDTGAPVAGVLLHATDNSGQYETGGESDLQGNYSIAVVADAWNVSADDSNPNLAGHVIAGGTNTTIANGQAIRVDFIVAPATGTIAGNVQDSSGVPVTGLSVWSYAFVNGNSYNAGGNTDAAGNYSLSVINGTWTVGLSCDGDNGLPNLGYTCVAEKKVTVPGVNPAANFVVYPYGTPIFGNLYRPGDSQFMFQFFGAPGTNYTVQVSTNMNRWFTIAVTNPPANMIFIQDNQATTTRRFYRAFTGP